MPRNSRRIAGAAAVSLGAVWLLSQSSTQTTLQNPPAGADAVFLVRLGLEDRAPTRWDGSAEVSSGELVKLIGYQMRVGDLVHPPDRWEASSRPAHLFNRRPMDVELKDPPGPVLLGPSLYLYLRGGPQARVRIQTPQGSFEFQPREIPPAAARQFLEGKVSVEHVAYPILAGRGARGPDPERRTENDHPSITVARDDSVWIAWQGFNGRGDRVYAERIGPGENASAGRAPHAVTTADGDVFRTAIAEDTEGKIWVVWSERVDDNWELYGRSFDGAAWSTRERLTANAQPDAQHRLVRDSQGRLHLVWQSWRNDRAGIFHKQYEPATGWGRETRVSDPAAPNCWEPAVAADRAGNLYAGWDQHGPDSYDVWMRGFRQGRWEKPVAVAATPRWEAYASLAADQQGRVWLAWQESGVNWGKDWGYPYDIKAPATGLYNWRKIRLAVWEQGQLRQPAQSLDDAFSGPENVYNEYPQLAIDGAGRVWCFFRRREPLQWNVYYRTPSHQALWEIYAARYEGGRWSERVLVPYSTGRHDMRLAVAGDSSGRLAAAWPTDRRNARDFIYSLSDVFLGRFEAAGTPPPAQLAGYSAPPAQRAAVHADEEGDVRRTRAYRYAANGKTYRVWRGDMHRHTELSWDGYNDGSTQDTYRYAIDAASLDFLATTEHNFGVEDEYIWWLSQKAADLYRIGNAFVPLFAYERSVPFPNGHRNIVFSYRGAPILDVQHYEQAANPNYQRQGAERLFGYLRRHNAIAMPHTSATDMGTDWRDYDPEVEPLVEIYQSDRNSYERPDGWRAANPKDPKTQHGGYRPEGFVSEALAKGYRLGFQASSDHLGVHTAYSMLIAEEFSRQGLLEAIRRRHAYGATDNIVLDFRLLDGDREYLMGDDARTAGPPRFRLHIEGTGPVQDVEIVKDNRLVYQQRPMTRMVDLEYRDPQPPGRMASFYYVRVRQQDLQVAWGSPIWVTRKP